MRCMESTRGYKFGYTVRFIILLIHATHYLFEDEELLLHKTLFMMVGVNITETAITAVFGGMSNLYVPA